MQTETERMLPVQAAAPALFDDDDDDDEEDYQPGAELGESEELNEDMEDGGAQEPPADAAAGPGPGSTG